MRFLVNAPKGRSRKGIRHFGGREYRFYEWYATKAAAQRQAERIRNDGYGVRIVPEDDGFSLFESWRPSGARHNPGGNRDNKGGGTMARKTPPRYKSGPKKGQFMPKAARRRKRRTRRNPIVGKAATRSAAPRRRAASGVRRSATARRNPPRRDILDTLTNGALAAGGVLVGKAAVRSLPQLLSLPQAGNVGLAVQAATAVAIGWVADRFIGADVGEMMLAGGLSAPMESLAIRLNIPWISTALSSAGTVSGYVPRRGGGGVVVWDRPGSPAGGIAGYVPARTGPTAPYQYN